jgi:hypothetical protein
MGKKLLSLIASSLAIGMSGCATLRPPSLNAAKACADWRWIGISRPEAQCPEIPGWTVRPLFPQLAPAQRQSGDNCEREEGGNPKNREHLPDAELIQELNRFCVYESRHSLNIFRKLHPPAPSADLVRLDQDCAALSGADTELDPKDWKSNYKDFFSEAGRQGPLPNIENASGVRLAFLDTQPTGAGFPRTSGNSPHGFTLANIAQNLICTAGSSPRCAAQITTRLALPVIDFDPKSPKFTKIDPERGGFLGMQSDLAEAIRDEVDSWRKDRKTGNSPQHLVLNLSLAWDARLYGGLGEEWITEMRAGTQAVYRALQYAARFDVLVLAAAGNQKCAPCDNTGPLLPAAWEKEGPQEQGCPKQPEPPPFLYAVGGVDSDGSPLANARPGGMPRRAAYGETAVVTGIDPRTSRTIYNGMIYSGSSVATAVVSSVAAVVWNSHPDWDSRRVMQYLDTHGDVLKFHASFWFPDPTATSSAGPPWVHRVSLCSAFPGPECVPWQPKQPLPRKYKTWSQGSCQPWLYPQPEDPPCMACIPPPK